MTAVFRDRVEMVSIRHHENPGCAHTEPVGFGTVSTMKMRTSALIALPVLAASLLLAGCTVTGPTENFSGLPDEEHITQEAGSEDDGLQAFWIEEGDQLAISISGSSTCPVVGSSALRRS